MTEPTYTIADARYAGRWNGKPQKAIHCQSDGTGFKTRAMRLVSCHLKARYSRREHAYIVSPAKAAKFETLFAQGFDANVMTGALER